MYSIDIMIEEHRAIKRMLRIIRAACLEILEGKEIVFEDFYEMLDFVKYYADEHHHGKEEKILFNKMVEHLGELGKKLITHGMLVEHDMGRLYMHDLREALERVKMGEAEAKLDIIANAISYTHLLERHIEKEDGVIYSFGEKQLSQEVLQEIHELTVAFEKNAEQEGVQDKYLSSLSRLEEKYIK